MTKEQNYKLDLIHDLGEAFIQICSFKNQIENLEKQINDVGHVFYNHEGTKQTLQFTKKRLKLFQHHYNYLLKSINK